MMLTTKARYAITAVIEISAIKDSKPMNLTEISSRQDIPLKYLEQIFSKLKNAGLVKAIKGPGGGYLINASPDNIRLINIVDAVGENIKMTRCSQASSCSKINSNQRCKTHSLWQGLSDNIRDYFSNISVQDILDNQI